MYDSSLWHHALTQHGSQPASYPPSGAAVNYAWSYTSYMFVRLEHNFTIKSLIDCLDYHSGYPVFNSRTGYQISWQFFRDFTQYFQKISGTVPQDGTKLFHPYPFDIIYQKH
jgi:hypothetical protein